MRSAIDSGNLPRARDFIDNYTQAVLRTTVPQPSALDALVVALAAVMAKYPQACEWVRLVVKRAYDGNRALDSVHLSL